MRVSIRCEECGYRHRLERDVTDGRPIWLVCHSCETPLRAEAPVGPASTRHAPASPAAGTAIWGGLFERHQAEQAS